MAQDIMFNRVFCARANGQIVEDIVIDGLNYGIDNFNQHTSQKTSRLQSTIGTRLDFEQGTDAVYCGMHIDITGNIRGKDYSILFAGERNQLTLFSGLCTLKVQYGIRIRNSYLARRRGKNGEPLYFDQPVMLLGFELGPMTGDWRTANETITELIAKNAMRILDKGSDLFWRHCDKHSNEAGYRQLY